MALTIVLAVSAVLAVADQVIKYFVVQALAPNGSVSVIDHVLSLVYVENRGVAFGLFQNHVWVFSVITLVLIAGMVWLILNKRLTGKLFYAACMLIIGGGLGNLIDRLFRGFVVDYLALSFFPPVCNFADYCITIGAVLLALAVILRDYRSGQQVLPQEEELFPSDDVKLFLATDENGEERVYACEADDDTSDSGTSDSGTSDSGTSDSGTSDSGTSDSSTSDSGTSNSGTSDSGTSDSSTSDSSVSERNGVDGNGV